MKALKFEKVTKSFGNNLVLDRVSFEVDEGKFVGVIGDNAAGKTTIAKIASGLLKPNSGLVTVFGLIPYKEFKVKKKIGFASHNTMLYPELTVYENLEFYGRLYEVKNLDEKIEELLFFFDLQQKRNEQIKRLSRGFRQRTAIARALINDPELLILDEVTTGLDTKMRQTLLDYLLKIKKTTLFITHYESELYGCDKIIEVKGGKVFEKST